MTTTLHPRSAGMTAVQKLAVRLADDAAAAAAAVEPAYRAINEARSAMYAAERAHEDAKKAAEELAALPAQLARALAWRGIGVVQDGPERYSSTPYRAAFAGGRVLSDAPARGGAPKGRAYGWLHPQRSSSAFTYEPSAGTNDPDKLRGQVDEARAALTGWLEGYTAEQWLRDHDIDPATAPALGDVVSVAIDVRARSMTPGGWWHTPRWSLTLGGATVDTVDDIRDLFPRGEAVPAFPGNGGLALTVTPPASREEDEETVRAFAVEHAARARRVMIERLGYVPELDR